MLDHLPGSVHLAPDVDELYEQLGALLMACAFEAVGSRGEFHLALSGGSTPERFYMCLVTDPHFRHLPWKQTHVWVVDERRVPETDERSNWKMMTESLVAHVPVRRRQTHPMPVMDADPAAKYEAALRDALGDEGRLDFVLLGMGDAGHTASIFPHSDAVHVRDRWVTVNDGPQVRPPPRVTMSCPRRNAARRIIVLVTGEKKTARLRDVDQRMADAGPDPERLPITGIDPTDGKLTWYLDNPAAGLTTAQPS